MNLVRGLVAAVAVSTLLQATPITLNSPSDDGFWHPLVLTTGNLLDFPGDQQTGQPSSDIVGSALYPGILMYFDDGGTPNNVDGTVYIRVRLGAAQQENFGSFFMVGADKDNNGSVDFFIGLRNNTGNQASNGIGIWLSGSGANTSPSTTSIANSPSYFCSFSNAACSALSNFLHVTAVDTAIPPAGQDLNTDGVVDYFLSFSVPFSQIASIANIADTTPLRFIFGTATQDNSFNQDIGGLNGIPKGADAKKTWGTLGVVTDPVAPGDLGAGSIPEPTTLLLAGIGLIAIGAMRRRLLPPSE